MIQGRKIENFIRCFILKSHSIFLQPHNHRRVYLRRWTRHSISNIIRDISRRRISLFMRSLNSIILMRISSINTRIIKSSLILSRSNLIFSSLSSRRVGVMLRGCRGWSTRPDQTTMEGGLLCPRFYLALVDLWHAGYGSMQM